ncbi:uncharacterized protein LOC143186836 isoform X2 [Calliopsis andreniformis]|uniref:uncharacterized protein LOC143186836 isoform X2 n=1 Tax=Calliopsis andreniformis TaxID=337506 RepID=UPI003FCE94D6
MVQTHLSTTVLKKKKNYRFPKDLELKKQWIQAIQRDNFEPSSHTKVCSKHFANDCFVQNPWSSRRVLKPDAVPNVLNVSEMHHIQELHSVNVPWIESENRKASSQNKFINDDIHSVNNNQENVPPKTLSRKKRRAYLGDFENCDITNNNDNYMHIMNRTLVKKNKQIKALQQKNRILTEKVKVLQSLLKELRDKQMLNEDVSKILSKQRGANWRELAKAKARRCPVLRPYVGAGRK